MSTVESVVLSADRQSLYTQMGIIASGAMLGTPKKVDDPNPLERVSRSGSASLDATAQEECMLQFRFDLECSLMRMILSNQMLSVLV